MLIHNDIIMESFPFPVPNPGQLEAINEAATAILIGDKKHIIIEAPTGIGKSAVAYTLHKILSNASRGTHRSTIITSTKDLQDQYTSEFKEIYNLMGKTNYSCPKGTGPYNSPDCRVSIRKGCEPQKLCPYVMTRERWLIEENLRCTNHSFQISAPPNLVMEPENKADIIIVDECHELEMNIIEHSILRISANDFKSSAIINATSQVAAIIEDTIMGFRGKAGDVFTSTREQRDSMIQLKLATDSLVERLFSLMKSNESNIAQNTLYSNMIEILTIISDRANLFSSVIDGQWVIMALDKGRTLEIKPVYAHQVSHYSLFRKSNKFIHMSSTICGKDAYMASLGIKEEDCWYVNVDNPIPVANRKVSVYPKHKVSGGFNQYNELANTIDLICDHHQSESGIIHTVSFALANSILANSKHKSRMLVSNNRREIIKHLSTKNGVILSPSLEKGFDAKDDLSRFQILPKVPYAYLGDPLIKYNSENRGDWYARQAILRIVQASGRSIRGVSDYAETYILDSNFLRLYENNKNLFPDWYLDSVTVY